MRENWFFLVLFGTFFYSKSYSQQHDVIIWSPNQRIKWTDFQGAVPDSSSLSAASTVTFQLHYKLTNKLKKAKVTCAFVKNKSWYRDNTDYLLNHEQGHFNIGEIVARMFRKRIREIKKNKEYIDKTTLEAVFDFYLKELIETQKFYDKETSHSINILEQEKWDDKIESDLNSLRKYKKEIKIVS